MLAPARGYAPLSDTPPTNSYINVRWGDEYGAAQYTGGNPMTAQWYKKSANQFSHGAPCATPDAWWKADNDAGTETP